MSPPSVLFNLTGKTAFVTGGGQGIGRGIVLELARAGADIVIADINEQGAADTVGEVTKLGRKAVALKLDVTDAKSIAACLAEALKQFPRIDILVNNAGVIQRGLNEKTTTEDLDRCYEVNVKGLWSVSRALIPHFKQIGEGKIVNIASIAGRTGHKLAPAYCASKASVISLTQGMADELGPSNINVNAICPGLIWTPMWESIEKMLGEPGKEHLVEQQQVFKSGIERTPLRRPQTAEDVGHAVVFLVSPQARNITGQALNVDGGLVMN